MSIRRIFYRERESPRITLFYIHLSIKVITATGFKGFGRSPFLFGFIFCRSQSVPPYYLAIYTRMSVREIFLILLLPTRWVLLCYSHFIHPFHQRTLGEFRETNAEKTEQADVGKKSQSIKTSLVVHSPLSQGWESCQKRRKKAHWINFNICSHSVGRKPPSNRTMCVAPIRKKEVKRVSEQRMPLKTINLLLQKLLEPNLFD